MTRLFSPVRHSLALKNGADPPGGRVTISPSLRAKHGRGAKPQADSTSTSRHTSNAKCLGELSTLCPLATSTTLNSRNRTNLPASARHKSAPPPTHRSIQDANYHNQIVKERFGAPLPGQGSTRHSGRQPKLTAIINRGRTRFALARGFERTCNRTRPLAIRSAILYRSTNQQSVALADVLENGDKKVILSLHGSRVNWHPTVFLAEGSAHRVLNLILSLRQP